MIAWLVRRLAWCVLVLAIVSTATFAIFFAVPNDPAALVAGKYATPETVQLVRHRLGLDRPKPVQLVIFLSRAARGDLGYSYTSQQPVAQALAQAFPRTLSLTFGAAVLWLLIGIPLGIVSALRPRSVWDRFALMFSLFGISAPAYWLGLMMLWIFADGLGWFPLGDYVEIARGGIGAWAWHLCLPWLTLALLYAGWYARMTRSQMLEVLERDHVRTARAKGLRSSAVVGRHVLRNALLPLITMLGMDVASLFGGAVLTETVFGIPGIGGLALRAIRMRDLPMVMGTVLFAALFIVIANLLVDILYRTIDPRIAHQA